MTLRPLPRSRLDGLIPSIVTGHHFIALVPVTGDARWAASAAWGVARAAAHGGRRVALIDLRIDDPQLHNAAGIPMGTGIVDVFQRNDDLTAAAQPIEDVYFIAAGTPSAAPEFVLAHPRWKKLHAGFRAEDALLLVYISGGALSQLAETPDGVIALAPEGVSLDSPAAVGLVAAQEHGSLLLGAVRERWTPMGTPAPPPGHIVMPPARRRRSRGGLVAVAFVALVLLGAAAWALFARGVTPDNATVTAAPIRAASLPGSAVAGAHPAPDTLAWTVQLAAYGTLDNALAHAARLADAHLPAFVTPVEATRAVWYRVLVGAFASRDSASAARDRLWDDRLARRGEGELLRAPYSLALPSTANIDSLRRRGIPAVRLHRDSRLLLGAFETPEQAALAQDQLRRAGIAASLIARVEVTP